MLHKIIGSGAIVTPFLRFATDSGSNLDPIITSGGAALEWISPDGSISTGGAPNPALDQTGIYTVKCPLWSDITKLDFKIDNMTALENLVLLTSINELNCRNNSISRLELTGLTLLKTVFCQDNGMDEENVDNILAHLVANSATNGTLTMAGSNAAPSAAGDADVLILEGRGWAVTVS